MTTLLVGPFNRVEGDLEIRLELAEGRVTSAYANAPLFRGFERMMIGKDPRDALTITPRICGICSISQSAAAALALSDAAGGGGSGNGARVAQLLHAVENVADHLTHFNLFFMPDFARPIYADRPWFAAAVARFTAGRGSAIRAAVEARAALMHITGMLAGKWPHTLAIQPGGVTRAVTPRDAIRIATSLRAFRRHLEDVLFGAPVEAFASLETPDALMAWETGDAALFLAIARDLDLAAMGQGPGRYMSFGAYPGPDGPLLPGGVWDGALHPVPFDAIDEDLSHAWMLGETAHPSRGETVPDEAMRAPAYSWCKAPRLAGRTVEVGAFARQRIAGHPLAAALEGQGVLARITGRLLEIARTQVLMEETLAAIRPRDGFMENVPLPREGAGAGLVEAARGSLGHWLRIEGGRISAYQIIAPTTWNFSPRDASGTPGPVEAALAGAPVREGEDTPVAVQHIVRSFDPCMVCTVH